MPDGRLIILTGPSCVGKSPLDRALTRLHPDLKHGLQPLVLYNDREPRPGEIDGVDYHFRDRPEIESLRDDEAYVVLDVRGDLQALDLRQLRGDLRRGDVFFEGNPFVGRVLQTHPRLEDVDKLGVFMAPLSQDEILWLKAAGGSVSLEALVADVMRRKLLRRTRRQKGELSRADLDNIETRAKSAYRELKEAHRFDFVLPNHDGEDSEHWDAFYYPIGDAGRALRAFVAVLLDEPAKGLERWAPDLLP